MTCDTNAAARNFTVGRSSSPHTSTPIEMCGCDCVLTLASAVAGYFGQNNSAIASMLLRFPLHRWCRQPLLKMIEACWRGDQQVGQYDHAKHKRHLALVIAISPCPTPLRL